MPRLSAEELTELSSTIQFHEQYMHQCCYPDNLRDLVDEVERSRALLKLLQWAGGVKDLGICPECLGESKHETDCELAALIGV